MSVPYLGGYIRDDESKCGCLRERNLTWEKNIGTTIKTAGKYPQESYAAVACVEALEPHIDRKSVVWF